MNDYSGAPRQTPSSLPTVTQVLRELVVLEDLSTPTINQALTRDRGAFFVPVIYQVGTQVGNAPMPGHVLFCAYIS